MGKLNKIWDAGTWYNDIWKDGTWKNGVWKRGVWENGTWKNGLWLNGTWEKGTWEDGLWKDGTWKGGVWETGWIFDPDKKGNFEKDWEWDRNYVKSPMNPKDYFDLSYKLKKNLNSLENLD